MPYILMYHSVEPYEEDPYLITVSPDRFAKQMAWLERRGLRGVSIRELLRSRASARELVGLTFDDGYLDFATTAMPILLKHGFTATVFAVAGRLGGHNTWDRDCPRKFLMSATDLRTVAANGMEVGSHTVRHTSLLNLDDGRLEQEAKESRVMLERILDEEVPGFAYPYGHVGPREAAAVRAAGYGYACAIWRSDLSGRYALARTYAGDRDGGLRLRLKRARHRLRWGRVR
jgi:peptidoglycan/xylan/chitin deacetylase (PgdA/CDA1 family)